MADRIVNASFPSGSASTLGGTLILPKSQGIFTLPVASADAVVWLGVDLEALFPGLTYPQFLLVHAAVDTGEDMTEYLSLTSKVTDTASYNVTRDLASAHATDPSWPVETPWILLGANGDKRIEISGNPPKISIIEQGATYDATVNVITFDTYGLALDSDAYAMPTNTIKFGPDTTTLAKGNGKIYHVTDPSTGRARYYLDLAGAKNAGDIYNVASLMFDTDGYFSFSFTDNRNSQAGESPILLNQYGLFLGHADGRPTQLSGPLAFGDFSAQSGQVRLSNAEWVSARNAAGTADVNIARVNAADQVELNLGYTNWTPTITQGVAVSVTVTEAVYSIIGETCHVQVKLAVTGAGTAGQQIVIGGMPTVAQPALFGAGVVAGTAHVLDSGTTNHTGDLMATSATQFKILVDENDDYLGATPSFALASGDTIGFSATYRVI